MPQHSEVTVVITVAAGQDAWSGLQDADAASATGRGFAASLTPRTVDASMMLIRLGELRGAIEALRNPGDGSAPQSNRTRRTLCRYGRPALYDGMCFIVR